MMSDEQLKVIEEEIQDLKNKGNSIEDLDKYISALHTLNEVKDSAQIVMGKLAEMRGVTVEQIHREYGLADLPSESSTSKTE